MLCTITGHRPQSFPFGFDEAAPACLALKAQIKKNSPLSSTPESTHS